MKLVDNGMVTCVRFQQLNLVLINMIVFINYVIISSLHLKSLLLILTVQTISI